MLDTLENRDVRVHVCTIYTAVPFADPVWRQFAPLGIGKFNEIILEEASARKLSPLRLDKVCIEPGDFSTVSPIEPSNQGGQKIVDHIISKITQLSS